MTASVKFRQQGPDEIVLHFDDTFRKPKPWTLMRETNLDYIIEHGTLIMKHTKSRFLFMVDIDYLKELAQD